MIRAALVFLGGGSYTGAMATFEETYADDLRGLTGPTPFLGVPFWSDDAALIAAMQSHEVTAQSVLPLLNTSAKAMQELTDQNQAPGYLVCRGNQVRAYPQTYLDAPPSAWTPLKSLVEETPAEAARR